MREGESPQQKKCLKFYSAEDKRVKRHENTSHMFLMKKNKKRTLENIKIVTLEIYLRLEPLKF